MSTDFSKKHEGSGNLKNIDKKIYILTTFTPAPLPGRWKRRKKEKETEAQVGIIFYTNKYLVKYFISKCNFLSFFMLFSILNLFFLPLFLLISENISYFAIAKQ